MFIKNNILYTYLSYKRIRPELQGKKGGTFTTVIRFDISTKLKYMCNVKDVKK
jgi:hypothetical protein